MDTRDTPEQAELRRSARQLARELAPATVADLDDAARAARLAAAVRDAGWLGLRDDDGSGAPLASGVEAAIVAEALGERVADVAFAGPLLAADLARRAGVREEVPGAIAFAPALTSAAVVAGTATESAVYAIDAAGATSIGILVGDGTGFATMRAGDGTIGTDLTRAVAAVPPGTVVAPAAGQSLTADDLAAWEALGLALTSADLVGVVRGVLDVSVEYAGQRKQFGVAVGSFQAVQHLLAEARCLLEGSSSITAYAAWAVDNLEPVAARDAGRRAKAYCARAARTVCETAVQVHGGIGNTWECIVHVYLRRALLSSQWCGDDAEQLRRLAGERREATVGLP